MSCEVMVRKKSMAFCCIFCGLDSDLDLRHGIGVFSFSPCFSLSFVVW